MITEDDVNKKSCYCMKKFILLLNHDDISLSAYLQHCLEQGEQFVKASSNIFSFSKTKNSGERIAAVTYTCGDPDMKMKFEIEDYAAYMKKKGWRLLQAGAPENLLDTRRHVFLQTDQPELPFPDVNPELAEKAKKREKRSLIRCFAMLLLLAGFMIIFLSHDPDIFMSSLHILLPFAAGLVFWILSLYFSIRGSVIVSKKLQCADGFKDYLTVDKAVLNCMLAVSALLIALAVDLWKFPDTSRTFADGEHRIKVYQDALPLHLEDLEIPTDGKYRSSRFTQRSSFLMQSQYGSDQSFSDPNGVTDLSLISWSVFRSDWEPGLDWVAGRKGMNRLPFDEQLSAVWHSDNIHSDGLHRVIARYPGAVLIFASSSDINGIDPDLVLSRLLLDQEYKNDF